ncbi:MAG: GAF domain-containing protein, partial [Anaerolineales bacterium]|nr:GAF domain-containing protein [Anaerolineales bacterium]
FTPQHPTQETRPFHWHCRRHGPYIYAQARPLPSGDSQLSQDQLIQILNAIPDVIIVKRNGSQLVWGNNAFRSFFEVDEEKYKALLSGEAQPPADAQFVQEDEYVFNSGETLEIPEDEMPPPDGSVRIFNTIKSPIKDEDDHVVMLVGVSRDITSRREAEAVLIKRAAELEILRRVSTTAATTTDIGQSLQEAVNLIKISFSLYHAHIFLTNEAQTSLILRVGAENVGPLMVAEGYQIALNDAQSLVARAARTRSAIIENDLQAAPSYLPNPHLPESRSSLAIPMVVGDTLVGVFNVQSDHTDHFSEEDIRIHTTLAEQMALAWQNAQYFERSERALGELNVLMRRLTREGWEAYLAETEKHGQSFEYETGMVTAEEGASTAVDQVALLQQALTVQGETIGTLELDSPQDLSEDAADIMAEVAERLSLHLENLRLTDQTQNALSQTASLYNASTRLNSAQSLDEVLQLLSEQPLLAHDVVNMSINYFEPAWTDEHPAEWVVVLGRKSHLPPTAVRPRYPVSAFPSANRVLRPDQTVCIHNIATDDRLDENLRTLYQEQFQGVSTLFIPLVVAGQWLGYLNVIFEKEQDFSDKLLAQFESVVQQAAVTIQGIFLDEQREQARAQTEALYEGTNRVVRASNVEEVLNAIVQSSVLKTLDRASILFFDRPWADTPPTRTQVIAAWEQHNGEAHIPVGTVYGYTALHEQQFSRTEPRIYANALEDPLVSPETKKRLLENGFTGLLYLPLVVNNDWIGVLAAQSRDPLGLAEEDVRQLVSLTSQAAIVLANRRLLLEAQARAERERQVRAITDRIRRGTTREGILQIARDEIMQLLNAPTAVVQLGTQEKLLDTVKQKSGVR